MQPNRITYNNQCLGKYTRDKNQEAFFALVWLIEQINDWLFNLTNTDDEEYAFDVNIYEFDPDATYLEILNNGINVFHHGQLIKTINNLIADFKSVNLDTAKLEEFAVIYRAIITKHDLDDVLNQPMGWGDIGLKNGLYVNRTNTTKILTRVLLEHNEAVSIYANQYTNSIGANMPISIPVWYVDKIVPAYLDTKYLLEALYPKYDSNIARHVYLDTAGEVHGLTHGLNLANTSDYYALFTYIDLHLPDYNFNASEDPDYIKSFLGRISDLCDNRHDIADKQSILSLLSDCQLNDKLTPRTQYVTQSGWQLFYMGNYFVLSHTDYPRFMIVAARYKSPISSDELTETIELFLSPHAKIVDKKSFTEPLGIELKVINIYSYYIPELISLAHACNSGNIHSVITIDKIVLYYQPIDDTAAKLYVFSQDDTLEYHHQYLLTLQPSGDTND